MRNSNFGIGVYMLKSNIDVFFVTSFLSSLKFSLFHRIKYPKRCQWKKKSLCDMTVPSKSNVPSLWPWPLTYQSIFFQWIEYNPISILHKFQIDISSNSREIKYQNIGRTHRHTDRHTHRHTNRQTDRVKTLPRNPLRGRGSNVTAWLKHIYPRTT